MVQLSDVHVQLGGDIEVTRAPGHDLEVGLSWDFFEGMSPVDLDCSVLVMDFAGMVIDACYYNNLTCLDGALKHSGDSLTGEGDNFDEAITIDIDEIGPEVTMLVFLVNAHQGGNFEHVESAFAVVSDLLEGGKKKALADVSVGCGQKSTGCVLGLLYRRDGQMGGPWLFRNVGQMCGGTNFVESMPEVKAVTNQFIDPGLLEERTLTANGKSFNMKKGDSVEIPADLFRSGDDFYIGLGWTARYGLDLDASILAVDSEGKLITCVNFANQRYGSAINHQGDNQTGDGDGDDERIDIDLDKIPPYVHKLFIVVNIYSTGGSFEQVSDAYVRMVSISNGHEFCKYNLDSKISTNGLLFAQLYRGPMGNWQLNGTGKPCNGRVADDSEMKAALKIRGDSSFRGKYSGDEEGGGDCCTVS
ncbi:hypothetical protein TrVE_jg3607 [Triparma verrucosa]|uniref:TerD domain-containing protein n=1 Tax=Triparma verrucosa TaxID=1606542 RepID=A0A9W7F4D1_9STRA|nr:hypothetical protein TrVE_jg3607 [Triparma verrucosa]